MKRLLAVILALATVISALPAAFALTYGDADVPESLNYVFDLAAHPNGTSKMALSAENHAVDETVTAVSSGKWGYGGRNQTINFRLDDGGSNEDYIYWTFKNPGDATNGYSFPTFNPESDTNPAVCLEIYIPEDGYYIPTVRHWATNGSVADLEVFLIKKEAGTNWYVQLKNDSGENRLGKLSLLASGTVRNSETSFPTRELSAGSYYLVFTPNGSTSGAVAGASSSAYFQSFRLDTAQHAENVVLSHDLSINAFEIQGKDESETGLSVTDDKSSAVDNGAYGVWKNGTNYVIYNFANLKGKYDYVVSQVSDPWQIAPGNSYGRGRGFYIDDTGLSFNSYVSRVNKSDYAYYIIKAKIPYAGKYNMALTGTIFANSSLAMGADADIHVIPVSSSNSAGITLSDLTDSTKVGSYKFYGDNPETQSVGEFEAPLSGEYYIGVKLHASNGAADNAKTYLGETAYNDTSSTGFATAGSYLSQLKGITLTLAGLTDAEQSVVDERTVDTGNFEQESFSELSNTVRILTHDIESNEGTLYDTLDNLTVGEQKTVTAPKLENKTFLYWAKGFGKNKHVLADTSEYTFTVERGLTYLYAVYRSDASEKVVVEFFNANRALVSVSGITYSEDDEITLPELPYMTGFGQSTGWILSSTREVYTNAKKPLAKGKTMIFVAEYPEKEELPADVTVTVSGGTGGGSFRYGDEVTVIAPKREGGTGYNVFNYWTKKNGSNETEIISFSNEYVFRAVEDCTLTAVYKEYTPLSESVRKIILSTVKTGNENAVVAEFIGCETAIEKGFVFGTGTPTVDVFDYKAPMKTNENFFSIINGDSTRNLRAYAIFENGVIYSK